MFDKPVTGCIRTKQDDMGMWTAWTEGLPIACTVQGQPSDGRAQAVLIAMLKSTVEQLQAFLRFPPVNPPEKKESK